jgi:hypothetical protein
VRNSTAHGTPFPKANAFPWWLKFLTAPAKLESTGRFASTVQFYANHREPYPPIFFKKGAGQIALRGEEALLDMAPMVRFLRKICHQLIPGFSLAVDVIR